MIALLRGRIAAQGEDHVVIDTGGEAGGVGYLVQCAGKTLHRLPPTGQRAELRIITQVREDSITLYGFLTPVEEQWFRILQGIQGVGARLALAVLSVLEPEEIGRAIAAQDARALTRAAGVGPKLAGRIVAELKDRVAKLPAALAIGGAARPAPAPAGGVVEDALAALQNLGYGRSEAYAVVARVQNELGIDATLEQLLAASLKGLAR
ncbi:MAG: Holliday junction branch migration protein RuvA [Geminicoccaceae bacterium]|jgi:Holliday junction DNA helicase RuvA|nr:Holliday junction branch migration protein RuvA [Geminicoccaceae bacterium]MCB9966350.1 Holliday junction branch migration protein RuvA [Geminicoccaceae bacterium]HRY23308.1 Holliday junction branch migration protein RuvA [Geminicoccaceae bacterium]